MTMTDQDDTLSTTEKATRYDKIATLITAVRGSHRVRDHRNLAAALELVVDGVVLTPSPGEDSRQDAGAALIAQVLGDHA